MPALILIINLHPVYLTSLQKKVLAAAHMQTNIRKPKDAGRGNIKTSITNVCVGPANTKDADLYLGICSFMLLKQDSRERTGLSHFHYL